MASVGTTKSAKRRLVDAAAWGLPAAVAWVAGVWGAPPGGYWLDSNEFVAAAATLGVPHPPSHPLYVLVAHLAVALPLGPLAWRIHLVSAAFAALAAALTGALAARWLRLVVPAAPQALRTVLALAAGCATALTPAVWFHAVRAEVYAMQLALGLAAVWFASASFEASRPRRHLLVAAVLVGLGGANHHLLALLWVPGLVALAAAPEARRALRPRAVAVGVVFAALAALLPYAATLLRARAHPIIEWGYPESLGRLVDVVTARVFHTSVERTPFSHVPAAAAREVFVLMGQIHPAAAIAAACGLVLVVLRRRLLGAALVLLGLANLAAQAAMDFDAANPDAWGYMSLTIALAASLAPVLPAEIAASLRPGGLPRRLAAVLGACVAVAWAVAVGVHAAPASSLRDFADCEHLEDAVFAEVPPGALAGTRYFGLVFAHWEAQLVEGRRPDIAFFNQAFDGRIDAGRPYARAMRRRMPRFAAVFDEWLHTLRFPLASLREVASSWGVFLEPEGAEDVPAAMQRGHGPVFELLTRPQRPGAPALTPRTRAGSLRAAWQRLEERLGAPVDAWTRGTLLWLHYHAGWTYLRQGLALAAATEATEGLSLDPLSPPLRRLQDLAERMGALDAVRRAAMARELQHVPLDLGGRLTRSSGESSEPASRTP